MQTPGVWLLKVTDRPELAVALRVALPPTVLEAGGVKAMVWSALPTVIVRSASGAGL